MVAELPRRLSKIEQRKLKKKQKVENRQKQNRGIPTIAANTSEGSLRWAATVVRRHRNWLVSVRLYKRFYQTEVPPPDGHICEDIRYWHLRKLGYDVLSRSLRHSVPTPDGPAMCDPRLTSTWAWWAELHWKERMHTIDNTPHRLLNNKNYVEPTLRDDLRWKPRPHPVQKA